MPFDGGGSVKPKNLYAFDGRIQDFEWTPVEPAPAKSKLQIVPTPTVAPVLPAAPPIFWGTPEFDARIEEICRTIKKKQATPEWQAAEKIRQAEKAERQRTREARIAARRLRSKQHNSFGVYKNHDSPTLKDGRQQ
jgi:hypothetical protein